MSSVSYIRSRLVSVEIPILRRQSYISHISSRFPHSVSDRLTETDVRTNIKRVTSLLKIVTKPKNVLLYVQKLKMS